VGLGIEKLNLDLESGAISGKGVFEQFTPLFCAAARPKLCKRTTQIVLGHGPRLRRFSTLIEGQRPLTNLRCFFQLQVAVPRFDRYALLYKEPCEGVSRIGPVRLQGKDVGEEAVGLGELVAVDWSWALLSWRRRSARLSSRAAAARAFTFSMIPVRRVAM